MSATRALSSPPGRLSTVPPRLREDLPVIAIASLLLAACLATLAGKGITFGVGSIYLNTRLYLVSIAVLVVLGAAMRLVRDRPARPISHLGQVYFGDRQRREHMLGALPGMAILCGFMPFFSTMKASIPLFNEYDWDRTFIDLERSLLFGHDAWELLQPVLGYPHVTAALAVLYHLWILLCYPGAAWFLLAPIDNRLRRRFLLSFVLSWMLIGGVMAIALASYGPCFVGRLAGMPDFDAQMAYLREADKVVPVMTLFVQDMLALNFRAAESGLGSGISAMPSMHVAICTLFFLAARGVSPRLGRAALAFGLIIWAGSVHLAYHYALDGVVSAIAVILIWKASAALLDWWDARTGAAPTA